MTRETGRDIAIAATFMMKFVRIRTKVATLNTNTSQCAFWNNKKPFNSHPLGSACLPETETDTHGTTKEEDDIPGYILKFFNGQHPEQEE